MFVSPPFPFSLFFPSWAIGRRGECSVWFVNAPLPVSPLISAMWKSGSRVKYQDQRRRARSFDVYSPSSSLFFFSSQFQRAARDGRAQCLDIDEPARAFLFFPFFLFFFLVARIQRAHQNETATALRAGAVALLLFFPPDTQLPEADRTQAMMSSRRSHLSLFFPPPFPSCGETHRTASWPLLTVPSFGLLPFGATRLRGRAVRG